MSLIVIVIIVQAVSSTLAWLGFYVGIRDFHAFRHANATMMDKLGTPLKVRQERLGHSDSRITQAIYTHVASEDSRRVAAQLGEAVWGVLAANGRKKGNGSGGEPPKPFAVNQELVAGGQI